MLIDLVFGLLVVLSFIPLLTAYCACSYGRSFWLWFALGAVLPVLSFIVLAALLHRKEMSPGEQLLADAKDILAAAEADAMAFDLALEQLSATARISTSADNAHAVLR
jgi:hypothetical protein